MRIGRLLVVLAMVLTGLVAWGRGVASASTVPTCSSSDLTVHAGFSGAAAGNGGTPIVIVNHGPSACSLNGFPNVVAHIEASSPRPVIFVDRPRSLIYRAVHPRVVVLAIKGTASFGISYVDGLDQQFGYGARCEMNEVTVRLSQVPTAHTFVVSLLKNGHDGFGPINSCFAGFILGLTPIVKGSLPPEY